jgi:C-terminal processing protease CtpA/Prc
MKNLSFIWVLLLAAMVGGCELFTGSDDEIEEPTAEKQFVWNAMNYWYYWQAEVPELGDDYFDSDADFNNYLKDFSDAEALFESFRHPDDDFSFFIDDYEEYNREQDGIYAALGFNYGFIPISETELMGYVRYIIPNSPAEDIGLNRLDLFTKVDGTTITRSNFLDLLTNDSSHELTMVHLERTEDSFEIIEDSTVTVPSEEVVEDPVLKTKVIDTVGVSIGYVSYNAFRDNYHARLNEVFGGFSSQNIDELVLDLRYNGGGSVLTSQLLASLISGLGSSDKYATLDYNEKRSANSRDLFFLDEVPLKNEEGQFENSEPINNLHLSSLYVLVSRSTASASEAVINSLKAYMDITIIGLKTVGKDEGSLVLYDKEAPYTWNENPNDEKPDPNPDHKKAIQPIVTKIVNSQGADYPEGFKPEGYNPTLNNGSGGCPDDPNDNCVNEITVDNLIERPGLGSPGEPLFSRAIDIITGQQAKRRASADQIKMEEVRLPSGVEAFKPHRQGMHVEPFMVPTIEK